MSFYADGSTSGVCDGQRRQGAFEQTGGGRRKSDLSTFLASSVGSHYQRNDWSNAGGHEQPAQPPGRWYWTPQLWVWGSTLEEAVQEYLSQGWMTLHAELIDFLHESVDCQSQRSSQKVSEEVSASAGVDNRSTKRAGSILGPDDMTGERDLDTSVKGSRNPNTGK